MKGTSKNFVRFIRSGLLLMAMVFAMAALPGFASRAQAARYPDYLSFTAVNGDVTIGMKKNGTPDNYVLEYSIDRENWMTVKLTNTKKHIITILDGLTVYFRTDRQRDGLGNEIIYDEDLGYDVFHYWNFLMTGEGEIEAAGNVMSLLDPTCEKKSVGEYAFINLFVLCNKLTKAPELPARTLAERCYEGMFFGCDKLTKAPELPAQTLAMGCYQKMFVWCNSLTKAPELSARTMAERCYYAMFEGCGSLTEAPELPAQTLADSCYAWMFNNCDGLTKAPLLPAQTLADNCYTWMFNDCDGLTEAPELPAKTLVSGCYNYMFSSCEKISAVIVGFTGVEADCSLNGCLYNWLDGVSETGRLYCPESTLQYTNKELGLPEGWVKKDVNAPDRQKINSFVTRMYEQCLSREPDQAGLDGWAGQLDNGSMNGATIAQAFVFSNEMLDKNLSDAEFVKVLYRSMMGREADKAGLAGWVSQLRGGYLSRSEVTEAFVESIEFTTLCERNGILRGDYVSVGDIERFVTRFYTICLGRQADQKGHWGWVVNLRDQNMNGAQIAEAFFFSEEFVGKNVSDEAYVDLLYRTIMGREPDEAGKSGWVNELKKGYITRKDMLKAFIESNEFTRLCAGYGIERGSL